MVINPQCINNNKVLESMKQVYRDIRKVKSHVRQDGV